MSVEYKFENHQSTEISQDKSKVKLTDLLSRLNQEKKRERTKSGSYSRSGGVRKYRSCCNGTVWMFAMRMSNIQELPDVLQYVPLGEG